MSFLNTMHHSTTILDLILIIMLFAGWQYLHRQKASHETRKRKTSRSSPEFEAEMMKVYERLMEEYTMRGLDFKEERARFMVDF